MRWQSVCVMFTGSKQEYEKEGVPRVWEKRIGLFANSIRREGFELYRRRTW